MPPPADLEPALALIVAVAENGVIGADNRMPWRLSTDLKRFKAVTWGKPVIMGRKTFQSIGQALPGRTNIIITRDQNFTADNVIVVDSIDQAISEAETAARQTNVSEIIVAGGAEIYRQTIDLADRLYMTTVHATPVGDALFPAIIESEWKTILTDRLRSSDRDSAATTYRVLDRLDGDE
ncbi:MAG: dihydrofolate reductase [Hyphomicrobiales bacterium]|nr:dihydrofolate reductase [Hyphomicrobiales bacterium]OQW84820.1 MAG: hypothetical protein BVN31_01780 [Proteobacteria bacterium ST_bin15]